MSHGAIQKIKVASFFGTRCIFLTGLQFIKHDMTHPPVNVQRPTKTKQLT